MKVQKESAGRFFEVLRHMPEPAEPAHDPEQWEHTLMRRIRRLEPAASVASFFQTLEQAVWKLSPVMILLIVLCSYALIHYQSVPDWQAIQILPLDQPANIELLAWAL